MTKSAVDVLDFVMLGLDNVLEKRGQHRTFHIPIILMPRLIKMSDSSSPVELSPPRQAAGAVTPPVELGNHVPPLMPSSPAGNTPAAPAAPSNPATAGSSTAPSAPNAAQQARAYMAAQHNPANAFNDAMSAYGMGTPSGANSAAQPGVNFQFNPANNFNDAMSAYGVGPGQLGQLPRGMQNFYQQRGVTGSGTGNTATPPTVLSSQGGSEGHYGQMSTNQGPGMHIAARMGELNPASTDPSHQFQMLTAQIEHQQGSSPGLMDTVMRIWNSLDTWQKMLVGGGLSLGAIGLLGSLLGNEHFGGGTGMLMGLGGLAAAAFGSGAFDSNSQLRQMMGGQSAGQPNPMRGGVRRVADVGVFGNPENAVPHTGTMRGAVTSSSQPGTLGQPAGQDTAHAGGQPTVDMTAIRQTARSNPQQAAAMIGQAAASNPVLLQSLRELDSNLASPISRLFVTPEVIAGRSGRSGGQLTVDDARMLLQHWQLIRSTLPPA